MDFQKTISSAIWNNNSETDCKAELAAKYARFYQISLDWGRILVLMEIDDENEEGNSTITTTGHHATNFGQSPLIQHPNGLNTQFSKRADICNDWESHKDIIPPHIQNPMN